MLPDRSVRKNYIAPLRGKLIVVPEYSKLDQISGVYSGMVRARCRRSDEELSPYQYWHKNKDRVFKEAGVNPTTEQLDTALWSLARGCGAFKPRVAAAIYKLFSARRVLDFSSGWGDRLLAAIALDVRYVGVDPNPDLVGPYKQMIQLASAERRENYTMIESPFQTAELPEGEMYDLVFTSPPYYDLELYATDIEGSNLNDWKSLFLYPSIKKAWSVLEVGGHLCLSINDYKRVRYVSDMVRFINVLPGARNMNMTYRDRVTPYLASSTRGISSSDVPSAAPLWCWRKEEGEVRADPVLTYLSSYPDYQEFVYTGGADMALSVLASARQLGKKCTFFLSGSENVQLEEGRAYYFETSDVALREAQRYHDRTVGSFLVPTGLECAEYLSLLD